MRSLMVILACSTVLGFRVASAAASPLVERPLLLLAAPDHPPAEAGDHSPGVAGAGDHSDPHVAEAKPEIIDPKGDLALWSVVTFVVLLVVLRLFAWGPIVTGLDTRESRIRDDIAQAEAARTRANQLLAEHEERLKTVEAEIRDMRSEARAAADQVKAEAVAVGKQEAIALVAKAKVEIEQDRRQAEDQLKRELAAMVVSAAETVIGRKLNDGDEQRLADEALQQFAGSV